MPNGIVPPTAKERGKIAPAKFAHAVIRTNRFDEMVGWYKSVLELEPLLENAFVAFLTFDEEHHRIAIARAPGMEEKEVNRTGVDHFAFTYASIDDLLATYVRLKELGVEPSTPIHHGPTLSFYYLDPDRNEIELFVDVFDDVADQNEWMKGAQFNNNPIGVIFDPDDLVKRWQEGEPHEQLLKPLEGPMPGPGAFADH